jgi:ABC-type transport system involved in cytochrome c biogenesis ATPase subunit
MRLARLRLRNFRCYRDEVCVDIGSLTVLVGKNDIGKSTMLDALAIFFEETKIECEDASVSGNKEDVRIICEFDDLPDSLVIDTDYSTTLQAEYLLNAAGRLEIHKVYNCALKTPKTVTLAFARHPSAKERDDLLTLKNSDLKSRAQKLGIDLKSLDPKVNTQLRRAIWANASDLELSDREISLDSETGKKLWDQLKLYLPSFALFKSDRSSTDQDAEAQDPMKAAIREALKAKEAELNAIAAYVESEVKAIASKTLEKLREMDPNLAGQLSPRFATPSWATVFKVALTGDEDIPINKRGSGVRRLLLLNFFRAKAEIAAAEKGTTNVIYAIEEPETSQHPNNQRMLMRAFSELADQPGCQVILTTHTPVLGQLVPVESLRYICEDCGRKVHTGTDETYDLVTKALGILPDHNVRVFIGVEGPHDINFLCGIAEALRSGGEDVLDLQKLDDDGKIVFFPLGGSNLGLWVSRLKDLRRPEFYLFDRDEAPPKQAKYQDTADQINARSGCKAVITGKREIENYLHPDAIRAASAQAVNCEVCLTFGDFDSVPALAAQYLHEHSESPVPWLDLKDDKGPKKTSRAKAWLNAEAARLMTPTLLTAADPANEVRSWLAEIRALFESVS